MNKKSARSNAKNLNQPKNKGVTDNRQNKQEATPKKSKGASKRISAETQKKTAANQSLPIKLKQFIPRLQAISDALTKGLVERSTAVRLGLLASLAGEHLLIIGPPGTAKSLIARRLHLAIKDASYFERLLTRFTVPEELFGPLSIKGLEEDRYERLTAGYLPQASITFLDEIFKANSAILNALLTLLNEREFDNGTVREKTPLVAVIGASNELPEGKELEALFDRFLLRLHVGPVSKEAFPELLHSDQSMVEIADESKLQEQELKTLQKAAESVDVPEAVVSLLSDLREWCAAEEIQVSDRRWRKVVRLLQTSAVTNGRSQISIWDCWLLQHCLWDTPEDRQKIYEWYLERVGAVDKLDATNLTKVVVIFEGCLTADRNSRAQMQDGDGKLLYEDSTDKPTTKVKVAKQKMHGKQPLFLAPENQCHRDRGMIRDRTNKNRGYTEEKLEDTLIMTPSGPIYFRSWEGRADYLADSGNYFIIEDSLSPAMEATRYSEFYIKGRLEELGDLKNRTSQYHQQLQEHLENLEMEIGEHLWVPSEFAKTAATNLAKTNRSVEELIKRISKLQQGFQDLPREKEVVSSLTQK